MSDNPFSVFRREFPVRVYGPRLVAQGVMSGGLPVTTSIECSVQRIGRTLAQDLTARGLRVSDTRRLYSSQRLPTSREIVTFVEGVPEDDSLILPDGRISQFSEGKGQPGEIEIDGIWYKMFDRREMLNGIINNYELIVTRTLPNDETL